jgi:hypothetical protein
VRAHGGAFFSQGGISAASDLDSGGRFQNRRLKAAARDGRRRRVVAGEQ